MFLMPFGSYILFHLFSVYHIMFLIFSHGSCCFRYFIFICCREWHGYSFYMYQVHRLWTASEDLTDESLEAHHVEGAFVEVLVYVGTCIFLMFLLSCNFN